MLAVMEARPEPEARSTVSRDELRWRLRHEISRLGRALESGTPVEAAAGRTPGDLRVIPVGAEEIRREMEFLEQVERALDDGEAGPVWRDRAGLGSVLFVREARSGRERFLKLMAGPLHPLDAGQVSLDSSVGRAFRGKRRGHEVWIDVPGGRERVRILTLRTLPQRLGLDPHLPATPPTAAPRA